MSEPIYFTYSSPSTINGLTPLGKQQTNLIIPLLNENDKTTPITTIGNGSNSIVSTESNLISITFANNSAVTSINSFAFQYSNLKTIYIPQTVTLIGTNSFQSCPLTSISTSSSQTSSYFYIDNNNDGNVLYTTDRIVCSTINITSTINNPYVILSGQHGGINNINVNTIDGYAFFQCTKLISVDLSKATNLQIINNEAFSSCDSLSIFDLSKATNLQTIGDFAFVNTSLTTIYIPQTVNSIGRNPFNTCSLISITTSSPQTSSHFYIDNNNSGNILYTTDRIVCSTINITSTINNPYNILSGKHGGINNIDVKTLDNRAFYNCRYLDIITLPNTILNINNYAFLNCINLKSIDLSQANNLISINNFVFQNCNLTTIYIPQTVTMIGSNPFKGCPLTSITTSSPQTSSYFYIDNNNGGNVLYTNKSIISATTNITSTINNPYNILSGQHGGINNINVITLGSYAFYNCIHIEYITIPSSINFIRNGTFGFCPITQINLINNNNFIIDISQGGQVLYDKFYYLIFATTNISSSYVVQSTTKYIYSYSFSSCKNLHEIIINSNLLLIFSEAFATCNLTNIVINNNRNFYLDNFNNALVLYSAYSTIYSTQNLQNTYSILSSPIINFFNQVINDYAFYNCSQVDTIIIPNTIYIIYKNAFQNCTNLKSVIFNGNPPGVIYPNIFKNCSSLKIIYYLPENSQYWTPRPWWIPEGVQLLPYIIPQYINKTLVYTTPISLNFIVTQNNKSYKLIKYYNNVSKSRNYQKVVNNVDLSIIASIIKK
jgi:hypothetical protein